MMRLILGVLLVAGCKSDAAQESAAAAKAALQGVSIFDEFEWHCSPEEGIGCSGTFDIRTGVQAEPISGREALGVRIASLQRAKTSIRVQALIFRADETGLYLSELLKDRKKAGVDVRVIVDAMSNLDWETQWMYFDLKRNGIEVEGYEALYLEWLTAEKLLKPLHANKRFHDKMWVVDDEIAIVGGLNLANEYFRVDEAAINRWQDQDVVLRGPVVADVAAAFDRNYDFFKRIKGKLPKVLNPDNAWKLTAGLQEKVAAVDLPTWQDETLRGVVEACGSEKPDATFAPGAVRFLQSRPRHRETYILQAYLALFESAQKSILIANAYFIPSREMVNALKRAADRGVEVTVLTNSPESNDISQVATMSRHMFHGLMREDGSGIQIYEWTGPEAGEGTLHAKFAVVDDAEAIIGSYNLDPRSERLNSETAIAIRDEKLGAHLAAEFRDTLLTKAKRVTWADAVAYHRPESLAASFELLYSMPLKSWL